MSFNLTTQDPIGIISLLISIGFNVYFLVDKHLKKKRKDDLYADLESVLGVIDKNTQSIKSIETNNSSNATYQLSSHLDILHHLVSSQLKKYQPKAALLKFKFYKSKAEVDEAMLNIIKEAEKYVFTVGGKVKVPEYVATIERKLIDDEFRYVRLVAGDHITDVLYDHIVPLLKKGNVELKYLGEEDKYGGIIVTKGQVFVALKTNDTYLSYGILIKEQNISEEYRSYIEKLSNSNYAKVLTNELCTELLIKYIDIIKKREPENKDLENKYTSILE